MPAAPPQRERARRARCARPPMQFVYVNSFGSHRSSTVIHLGRGGWQSPGHSSPGRAGAPRAAPEPRAGPSPGPGGSGGRAGSGEGRAGSRTSSGDPQEAKADIFDFPVPSRNVDKVIKRKKKKALTGSRGHRMGHTWTGMSPSLAGFSKKIKEDSAPKEI
ncbi:uncharacterized protein C5orf47 homolog isoform X2 [Poecile atricapillus]|uniref:uncharacterized protein C5orf47 homolog isoform X2 n=1 Tax=Poecile atricapillus TaxID=48891 RepID=UPI00273A32D5|nr:uncharacterized protein C5orf47 homolog isoform X2 [Poecile atricapillus]